MLISKKMATAAQGSSLVRKMFEEGLRMKAQYGAENVFDFSIGNPDLPPPPEFKAALVRLAQEDRPGSHGYMPNAGWPGVREKVAGYLTKEQGSGLKNPFTAENVLMTSGAAGALNVIFRAILDPGDEVITPRPYFMEYNHYADNHGAQIVAAEPGEDFRLNLIDIGSKISSKTRAILINSPHNPTGVIYSPGELEGLGRLLKEAESRHGRPIFLISDEPYRKLAYDGAVVPSVFPVHQHSIICSSYSKEISIPGERIGYAALNPDLAESRPLFEALAMANRILGFVSAPSLMQLVVGEIQGASVEVERYERRRDMFVEGLRKLGYKLNSPGGAFYLFPQSPLADDAAFVERLKMEKILTVPGRGFALPGYFRICYSVPESTIKNSLPGFARALEAIGA